MPKSPSIPEIFTFQKQPTNFQDVYFDSHAHIQYPEFPDTQSLVQKSKAVDLRGIVCVGINHESSLKAMQLAKDFPDYIYPTAGNHPYNADHDFESIYSLHHQNTDKLIGVGETGLDYFNNKLPKSVQKESFLNHANLAKELNLPLIIHLREISDCWEDCWQILKQAGYPKAIFHCFTGDLKQAQQVWSQGYKTSFSLLVTYPKNEKLKEIMNQCPIQNLLIETDSPYLPPAHLRGQVNYPEYLHLFL
jgi:TatD DNase family protein